MQECSTIRRLLFSAQRCCADTLSLIVTKSHQIDDLTLDESLDCRYCNDIVYNFDNHLKQEEYTRMIILTNDNPFLVSAVTPALTIHSQNPCRCSYNDALAHVQRSLTHVPLCFKNV